MPAGTGRFVRTRSVRLAAEQEVSQVSGYHDKTSEAGQDAFSGQPLGGGMGVIVSMTKRGEAKQGKAPDREQENQFILVLPASQQDSQSGGRQDGHQHPLMKSSIHEKTASQKRKSDQRNRHQQAMDSAYSRQGHRHAIQGELPFRGRSSKGLDVFLGHGGWKNSLGWGKQER